ncbi:MAG: NADH-quinone oxidoreductase subunit H [Sedimentisphaerales bacterium]|nr:NADH-quinone oxidoreductase subunit H [Sedimentisphaerales bacterium]
MEAVVKFLNPLLGLFMAPLLLGVISRTKAVFAGRNGQPILQPYHDLWKLLRKGVVYSRCTSWIFRAGPLVGLAAAVAALLLVPFGGQPAAISFEGDLLVFAYLLGLWRFFTVLMALDTASSFEGMGASREVIFSALAEPALLIGLATAAKFTGHVSLSQIFAGLNTDAWLTAGPALLLTGTAILIVFLAENSRIPIDDPNTHLELTMIHEVMILDHSGPDLGCILYAAALKLWLLGMLFIGIMVPCRSGNVLLDGAVTMLSMLGLAVLVGIIESSMARLRLLHVPVFLIGAIALSVLALMLVMR